MTAPTADHPSAGVAPADPAPVGALRGGWLILARGAWLALAAGMLVNFINGALVHAALAQTVCTQAPSDCGFYLLPTPANVRALHQLGLSLADYAAASTGLQVGVGLFYLAVGALIFWRKSHEWYGLFVALVLVLMGGTSTNPTESYVSSLFGPLTLPFEAFLQVIALVKWLAVPTFFLTFPSGRFAPRWTWALVLLWLGQYGLYSLPAPYLPPYWPEPLIAFEVLLVWGSPFAVQVYRYRRLYTPVQRQQTKWMVFAGVVALLATVLAGLLGAVVPGLTAPDSLYQLLEPSVMSLSYLLFAVAIGIALLRYRLFDIDIIIRRTLVYGTLTAGVVGLYVAIVVYVGALLPTGSNLLISMVATGLIAILFQPLRGWVQRGVNRLMYGQRDEPYAVVAHLGRRLENTLAPEATLAAIVETLAQALKLPYVAINLAQGAGFQTAAIYGAPVEAPLTLPLFYQSEPVGELVLGPRQRGDTFTPADRRLLEDLARQVGIAAHAVRLTRDLQRSRERLVLAREEERRRLRRDLHDGLGPTLAALALKADMIGELIATEPVHAEALASELYRDIRATVSEIRRLVYALRPPVLDELGLLAALQECAGQYRDVVGAPTITLTLPSRLPPLPAAVEVAALRITQETLTNAVRHSSARTCTVQISCTADSLTLTISDDGIGMPPQAQAGVGLRSMRERAEELGGACAIGSGPAGGVQIDVSLPLALPGVTAKSPANESEAL